MIKKMKIFESSPHLRRLTMLALCTMLIGFVWACSDEVTNEDNNNTSQNNFSSRNTGIISVVPGAINFDLVNIGETDQRTITISNTGNGSLKITKIQLIKNGLANTNKFNEIGDWSTRELKQNEDFDLTLEYAPLEETSDSGVIRIESNDLKRGTLDIPIRTAQRQPQIFTPQVVSFERVAPGSPESQVITVQNIGRSPLNIEDIVLAGHSAFSFTFPNSTPVGDDEEPLPDVARWPGVVEPDQSFPIRLTFAPDDTEPATSDLIFYTNDPASPEYKVKVIGNSGTACMEVTDESGIAFGPSPIGRTSRRAITITNCSHGSELEINAIELSNNGGGKFELPQELLPNGLPTTPVTLRPRESTNFTVTYDPTEEVADAGEILIKSNDPIKTALKIPVTGKGSISVCPTALAEARIAGTTQYKDELMAQPLNTIEFDGSRSSGNSTLTYEWSVLRRPSNSQSRFQPNNTVSKPTLWLDLAGDYEIELVVYDADGLASCESSIVKVHVVPGQEIHIQLTWFAPAVTNPRQGNGTDIDLHYRHPQGTKWNDRTYTVFWDNDKSTASWGSTPALANKATLDIDDRWGATTENINHVQPLNGSYEIGVHYYTDNGKGGADASLRIYVQGVLRHELLDKRMQHKQFWRAGALQWPSGDMIWIDQVVCDTTLAGFSIAGCRP